MTPVDLTDNLNRLSLLHLPKIEPDFLLTWEKSRDEILATLRVAEVLQELHRRGRNFRIFDGGIAISIFRDKSTRTRYSFASAANALGLTVENLDEEKSQIAHGETVRETATMLSFLTEVIGIRDDLYLGEGHRYMREVAASVEQAYRDNILHQRPPVINLQCDVDHPTQSLSDLLALRAHFGSLDALRGKKMAVTWAYSLSYGKPLSVPQGIIGLLTRFGMEVVLAHPEGYELLPEVEEVAARNAEQSPGSFRKVSSMEEAFRDADVVYPKSWAPLLVMKRRTERLRNKDQAGLANLEKEGLAHNARFRSWTCDEQKMAMTRDGQALYMHCLPADISGVSCEHGEVSAAVFEKYRPSLYQQAGFKPFVIAAMIWLARVPDPVQHLVSLVHRG